MFFNLDGLPTFRSVTHKHWGTGRATGSWRFLESCNGPRCFCIASLCRTWSSGCLTHFFSRPELMSLASAEPQGEYGECSPHHFHCMGVSTMLSPFKGFFRCLTSWSQHTEFRLNRSVGSCGTTLRWQLNERCWRCQECCLIRRMISLPKSTGHF